MSAHSQTLSDRIATYDLKGGNIGVSVTPLEEGIAIGHNEHQRFLPASSLKLATTASAFHFLGDFENSGWPKGTALVVETSGDMHERPDIRLIGTGDATLSAGPGCKQNCLSTLADTLASSNHKDIGRIIVDDGLFRRPYRPDGWSHDDLKFAYGAAISALTVNKGEAEAQISSTRGPAPQIEYSWRYEPAFPVSFSDVTTRPGQQDLELDLQSGRSRARFSGNLPPGQRLLLRFGLDDPSIYAGQILRNLLSVRGVTVSGDIVRADDPGLDSSSDLPTEIARYALPAPDPQVTLEAILHDSSNIDSEVLLQHVALSLADRTPESGLWLSEHILLEAGAEETEVEIADGSGLSVYNRVSPDAMTKMLVWASQQDWFDTWSSLIASNGQDGTLSRRFVSTFLPGIIKAKTGSVHDTDALAGYFTASSGRQYAFAIFINDTALSHRQARTVIDDLLLNLIASN
ncbi:MAG: D-alanyl-D-alanine carboxypeptidase/D-alanyl-D-alanine-endopeptidase [Henriciella sp.]|uniref:D-alanyl-D-alanine carboxypeptidase/D-alanyl-D-alanine endopeptidase n=1 Tax=Henriciella sp. TaxID=1968823 RepID=UPI003C76E085